MRTVAFVVTGPPTADIGAFVEVVDDEGVKVEVGWWERRGSNWAYVMPVELVPRLIVPPSTGQFDSEKYATYGKLTRREAMARSLLLHDEPLSSALDARAALKEKVRNAKRKESEPMAVTSKDVPAHWPVCPGCQARFDPAKDELLDCGNCGESRSTACCLTDPVRPCADCDALMAAGQEQGLVAQVEEAAPPSGRLFDGKFHPDPRKAAQAQAAGETIDDDGDGDADEEGDE